MHSGSSHIFPTPVLQATNVGLHKGLELANRPTQAPKGASIEVTAADPMCAKGSQGRLQDSSSCVPILQRIAAFWPCALHSSDVLMLSAVAA